MNASIFTELLLPLGLALIMFGMGLSLTKADFVQLFKIPQPIFVGLFGQLLLLPVLALAIAVFFELSAPLAIGLMIIAACPGGTTSNLFSHLAKANLALSISLTTFCTLFCVVSTPLIIQLSIEYFIGEKPPQFSIFKTSVGLFVVTLVPVLLGLVIRYFYETWAVKLELFFRRFSMIFMLLLIVLLVIKEHELLLSSFEQVFWASFSLNLISTGIGLGLGVMFSLKNKDGLTLGIEIGIQNATMAMLIAISFLNAPDYAITAGVYGVVMYLVPTMMIIVLRKFSSSRCSESVNTM